MIRALTRGFLKEEHAVASEPMLMQDGGLQWSDLVSIWPQLALPEQHQQFLYRYMWGAWEILWPKRMSDQVWPQYLETLKLLGGHLDDLAGVSSMRRHILQWAERRCFDRLATFAITVIRPYDESWVPASCLLDAINHAIVSTTDHVRITKSAFYRSFLMPPNHWLLGHRDKQHLLPQIADPLQLIGIVRVNGKWRYGVRLSALRQGPVLHFLEQIAKPSCCTSRKHHLRTVYRNLVQTLRRNPGATIGQMVSMAGAMNIRVSESTLRRYRTRILLQLACQKSASTASGILREIGQKSASTASGILREHAQRHY